MAVEGWTTTRLGDVIGIKHGWPFKSEFFSEELTGQPIVVAVGNFQYTGGFRFESTSVKEYRSDFPEDYRLHAGDILLVMTCQTSGGEILGIPARIPSDGRCYLHNQRLGKLIVKQPKSIDPSFVYWIFLSKSFNRELCASATGTKIVHTAPTRIEAYTLDLPPLSEQQAIACLLGTLNDKIELNRRRNRTLEAMARAIFQSWFVDFDPVRAKAAGQFPVGLSEEIAPLFPDSFEDSAHGPIPKGWRVATLGESVAKVAMGPFGSSIKTDNFVPEGVPVIRGNNLTDGFVEEGFVFLLDSKADELKNANAFPGDVVITHRGTLGQIGLIPKKSRYPRYVVSQSQMLVRVHPERLTPHYLYLFLTSVTGQHALLANTSQTGVPAIAQPTTSLKAISLICPSTLLLSKFESIAGSIFAALIHHQQQSRTLTALRDTLLPKLISGELRVPDAERIVKRCNP